MTACSSREILIRDYQGMTIVHQRSSTAYALTFFASLFLAGCSASLPSPGELGQTSPPPLGQPEKIAEKPPGPSAQVQAAPSPAAVPSLSPQGLPPKNAPAQTAAVETARTSPIGQPTILFRKPTVTLYKSETSAEAIRVAAGSLPKPLRSRFAHSSKARIEIMTIYGPRWISKSEIKIVPATSSE